MLATWQKRAVQEALQTEPASAQWLLVPLCMMKAHPHTTSEAPSLGCKLWGHRNPSLPSQSLSGAIQAISRKLVLQVCHHKPGNPKEGHSMPDQLQLCRSQTAGPRHTQWDDTGSHPITHLNWGQGMQLRLHRPLLERTITRYPGRTAACLQCCHSQCCSA